MSVEVKYYEAGNDLNWLVRQFETIQCKRDIDILDKFIPRYDTSLVFHFKTPPLMLKPVKDHLPPFFIAPVIPQANLMQVDKENDTFIVTCKPTVLSRIFHIDLSPDPRIYIPLSHDLFYPLWQKLLHLRSTEQRIKCFSEFAGTVYQGTYTPDTIDTIYNRILETGVTTPLPEIIKGFAINERTLQRKFLKRVGISPKKLVRIVRINYLWEKIKNNSAIDYQDMIFEGNYFDQTHFIKDFKAITGETPDYFFKRDLNIVKILSGKKTDKSP
jgi:AraC-like DNA-binding protein